MLIGCFFMPAGGNGVINMRKRLEDVLLAAGLLTKEQADRVFYSTDDKAALSQTDDDAPVSSIVHSLISQAVRERASDIHIEPEANHVRVRFRIDGMLREFGSFPKQLHAAIVSRIKIISDLDIAERRLPQDGRFNVQEQGRGIDFRISTIPTILGEKVVMRILDQATVILDTKQLGFSEENLLRFRQLCGQAYGMVLITGPTSAGKTTTLYSVLAELNSADKNIITIEDPVEVLLGGINQVQVNQKAGLTFAKGLRSILRQDPNIIMIGEIRDAETADIAIRAAMTGHLVFSTLHTNDAPSALLRLTDMGIEPFLVASSVLGAVAQRLVRLICPHCKQSYIPEADSWERSFLGLKPAAQVYLYRGEGCSCCGYTGYKGRMAIHEVMPVTAVIREFIMKCSNRDEVAALARAAGVSSMREDGIGKVLQGFTTVDEILRVAYTE